MFSRAPSRQVISNQTGVHEHLEKVVLKHRDSTWRKPISPFSEDVFLGVQRWLSNSEAPLILDSGCGTGESAVLLAERHPDHRVLGFDRSEVRLDKLSNKTQLPDNCLVVRADAEDLWRQLQDQKIHIEKHYLTFPNPYPKAAQLNKRWHGSPVFPSLIALGGDIELRSNWHVYLEEFRLAICLLLKEIDPAELQIENYQPGVFLSLFEKKYHESHQTLWRLRIPLKRALDH